MLKYGTRLLSLSTPMYRVPGYTVCTVCISLNPPKIVPNYPTQKGACLNRLFITRVYLLIRKKKMASGSPKRRLSDPDPDWDDDAPGSEVSRPPALGTADASPSAPPKTPHRKKTTMLPEDAPLMPSGAIARRSTTFPTRTLGTS